MQTNIKTGRIIGVLLLLQVAAGILQNFVFTAPLFGEPGFLINAAPHATQIAQSALLGIGMGLLSLAVASLLYPVFRSLSQPLALFYFALVTAGFALTVAENISIMSMLSLSKAYDAAGASQESRIPDRVREREPHPQRAEQRDRHPVGQRHLGALRQRQPEQEDQREHADRG